MKEYEKLLDRMHFEIGSTLMDNDFSRKGIGGVEPQPESEILRSNRRTYMNLKIMMLRLERALYGEQSYEEDLILRLQDNIFVYILIRCH